MHTMRLFPHGVLIAMVVLACVLPAQGQWSRDFGPGSILLGDSTLIDPNGTTGMILYDPIAVATGGAYHEVWNGLVSESLRMGFNGLDLDPQNLGNDSGLMIDIDLITQAPRVPTGNISAKVLIRYSTNPLLATTPTNSELNAGWLLRVDLQNLNGYICVMDDRGYLQLQKLVNGSVMDLCPSGDTFNVPNFDPTKDYWVRFELLNKPDGSTTLRAHAWMDGTDEPSDCGQWTQNGVECDDAAPSLPDGAAALVVNEDENITAPPQGNFIDMDNPSLSYEITCVEKCGDGVDNDGDNLADCADPDCDFVPGCVCNDPFADADGDGDVDQADFALIQACFTGEGDPKAMFDAVHCNCFDREDIDGDGHFRPSIDGDSDVDLTEFDLFEACASGAGIAADPNCDGVN
jgi:hypothetical protein